MKKAAKTLHQVVTEEKFATADEIRQFLIGRKIKIIATTDQNNYGLNSEHVIGEELSVTKGGTLGSWVMAFVGSGGYFGNNLNLKYATFSEATTDTLTEDIKRNKEKVLVLENQAFVLNEKLKFLEETKSEVVDEQQFLKYTIVNLLSSRKTAEVKAEELLALLK